MPFCPKCGYEYVENVTDCPDCQVSLVSELPVQEDTFDPNIELAALHSLPGIIYAEMVKEALEKEDIPCYIKSDMLSSAYSAKGADAAGQSAQIFVKKEDKDRAERILHEMLNHI